MELSLYEKLGAPRRTPLLSLSILGVLGSENLMLPSVLRGLSAIDLEVSEPLMNVCASNIVLLPSWSVSVGRRREPRWDWLSSFPFIFVLNYLATDSPLFMIRNKSCAVDQMIVPIIITPGKK